MLNGMLNSSFISAFSTQHSALLLVRFLILPHHAGRPALRPAVAAQARRVHGGCRRDAGPWHRRECGDVRGRQRRGAPAAAVSRRRQARARDGRRRRAGDPGHRDVGSRALRLPRSIRSRSSASPASIPSTPISPRSTSPSASRSCWSARRISHCSACSRSSAGRSMMMWTMPRGSPRSWSSATACGSAALAVVPMQSDASCASTATGSRSSA